MPRSPKSCRFGVACVLTKTKQSRLIILGFLIESIETICCYWWLLTCMFWIWLFVSDPLSNVCPTQKVFIHNWVHGKPLLLAMVIIRQVRVLTVDFPLPSVQLCTSQMCSFHCMPHIELMLDVREVLPHRSVVTTSTWRPMLSNSSVRAHLKPIASIATELGASVTCISSVCTISLVSSVIRE